MLTLFQANEGKKAALQETLEDTKLFLVRKMHSGIPTVLYQQEKVTSELKMFTVAVSAGVNSNESSAHSRKQRR